MASGSPGSSSLLYGPPSRRTPATVRDPARVEAEVQSLLADDDASLEHLLRFLRANELPGGSELVGLSQPVVRVAEALGEPGMADPFLEHHLVEAREAADTLLFRAYHRIGVRYSGKLLDRRLEDELRLGSGRAYLCGRIERLLRDPRVKRRYDTVLLTRDDLLGGVAYPTHLRHSAEMRPACQEADDDDVAWSPAGRARRPSCNKCLQLLEMEAREVARIPRSALDELMIYGENIILNARVRLGDRLADAPLEPEVHEEMWHRSLWDGWVDVMLCETRDIGGTSPLVGSSTQALLRGFWDPGLHSIGGRIPHFAI